MSLRILVTGGAGFQGSHIVEEFLQLGHRVSILNTYSNEALTNLASFEDRVSVVWGSVTDNEIVMKTTREHDVVVHLAARIHVDQSARAPGKVLDVNVTGTYNILEAVREYGSRLIYSSSCEVYGASLSGPTTEASELRPHSPYAASKAAADRLCFAYWKTYGTDVTIVRPCNIYGPRQRSGPAGAVIPIFVSRALEGKNLVVYGTGEQTREYMHVKDLANAYCIVLDRTDLAGQAINFGTGENPSIKEIAEFIAQKLGTDVEYGPARPGEVSRFELSSEKANLMGFTPRIPFWEGLERYIQTQSSHRS